MKNGLHIDTRTTEQQYQDGYNQGVADFADVNGESDAVERRIKFCAHMAKENEGTGLGHTFRGRHAGLVESRDA